MDELLRQNWLRRHRCGAALAPGPMVAAPALVTGLRQSATPSPSVPADTVAVAHAVRRLFRDMTSLQGQIEPRDIAYLDAAASGPACTRSGFGSGHSNLGKGKFPCE